MVQGPRRGVGIALGQPSVSAAEALRVGIAADRAGATMIGVGDGFTDAVATLGALSTVTEQATLMATVATWTRTPIATAVAVSALQGLSGGRVAVAFGAMPKAWSEDWHGVDHTRPVARMRDFIGAVRHAYEAPDGVSRDHDGPFYRFAGYRRLAPPTGHPLRVWIAATGAKMTELGGEAADGLLMNVMCSPEWVREMSLPAIARGAASARRASPVGRAAMVYTAIGDDEREAIDRARPGIAFYFRTPYFHDVLRWHGFERELAAGLDAMARGDEDALVASVSDEMVTTFSLAGSRRSVLDRLRVHAEIYDWIELAPPVGLDEPTTVGLLEQIVAAIPDMNDVFLH